MEARLAKAMAQYSDALVHVDANTQQYDEYILRLKTFELHLWFGKPGPLSPPAAARWGWSCSDVDMLTCSRCSSHLCVKLDDSLPEDEIRSLVSSFQSQLTTAHSSSCSWRFVSNPATHSVYPEAEAGLLSLSRRMEALTSAIAGIGGGELLVEGDVVMGALKQQPKLPNFPKNKFPDSTLALSVCNWEPAEIDPLEESDSDSDDKPSTLALECRHCGVRATLSRDDEPTKPTNPPPAKKSRLSVDIEDTQASTSSLPFDPIESHRYYCPVVSVTGEDENDFECGWRKCCRNTQVQGGMIGGSTTKDLLKKAEDVISLVH
ncbi:hypothetical protein TrLO_g5086 [Triparma laevis f. longispina]|uniref:C3HC-type domain-containing protein n=1 Tax=Triparma laevis f. longispina TaxID=1714387 RepID=A0A9W7AR81_9STRA|nr:hypothetical protein TrLO_g5086 [Triparma laevis f. longispina]